jgi:membrane protease YdiL (CAAX protease family)
VSGTQESDRLSIWKRPHLVYLGIACSISWVFWIASWLVVRSTAGGAPLLFNADLVWTLFFDADQLSTIAWLSLLSMAGVYGPMIGGIVATSIDPSQSLDDLRSRVIRVGVGGRWYGLVVGILALVAVPAAVIAALTAGAAPDAPPLGTVPVFLVVFFVFQMLTSGTEEIGWRGYLNEKLRHGRNFWDTGWAVGIPWAIWHLPVVVIMFGQQGMAPVVILGTLAGFGIGIVAMAILHAWFYERTQSVFLSIFIHAIFNTVPLATVLLYRDSPAALIANLALWGVVIYLKRRHDRQAAEAGTSPV